MINYDHPESKADKSGAHKHTERVTMSLDILPKLSLDAVEQQLQKLIEEQPEKSVKNGWKDLMPKEIKVFADFCINFSFEVDGTYPYG